MKASNIILIGIGLALSACQPPSKPASMTKASNIEPNNKKDPAKATDTSDQTASAAAPAPGSSGIVFNAGGADVGTAAMKASVTSCAKDKKFYDRQGSSCTSLPLAKVNCTLDGLKASLSEAQYTSLQGYLADEKSLKGFLVDQCLDCPDPSANAFCKGTGATPPASAGIRVFLVKQSADAIGIQTIFAKGATQAP